MGVFVGLAGFLGYVGVAELIAFVMKWTNHYIYVNDVNGNEDYGVFMPYLIFVGCSTFMGFCGCAMTAYYAQGASMSGLPEIIAITNGINYPQYFGMNILLTKMVGNTLAVAGKMCVGKEGPLAHSGANIGIATLYVPGIDLKFLHNDEKRREFMSAGASAGVAIAFGAPIGGSIFIYEHNWCNGFWRNKVFQWRSFTAAILATLVQTTGVNWYNNNWDEMKGTIIAEFQTFHKPKFADILTWDDTIYLWVGAVIMGAFGGLCGAFFININTRLNYIRRAHLTSKFKKTFECTLFVFVTANFIFWPPYLFRTCAAAHGTKTDAELQIYRGWCPKAVDHKG